MAGAMPVARRFCQAFRVQIDRGDWQGCLSLAPGRVSDSAEKHSFREGLPVSQKFLNKSVGNRIRSTAETVPQLGLGAVCTLGRMLILYYGFDFFSMKPKEKSYVKKGISE